MTCSAADFFIRGEKNHQPFKAGIVIMVETNDTHWVDQTRNGNTEGFAMLVNQYQHIVYHMAFRMTGDPCASEDITQNTFLKAYKRIDSYDRKNRFFSWLYRIGINETLNYIKKNRPVYPLNPEIQSSEKNPEEMMLEKETGTLVRKALHSLPARHRILIIMKHFQNLRYDEMAPILGISEQKVKARLYRARQSLKTHLIREGFFTHE